MSEDHHIDPADELLTAKELAFKLRRHVSYVYAMRRAGFKMAGYRTTYRAALRWLTKNQQPRSAGRPHAHSRTPALTRGQTRTR